MIDAQRGKRLEIMHRAAITAGLHHVRRVMLRHPWAYPAGKATRPVVEVPIERLGQINALSLLRAEFLDVVDGHDGSNKLHGLGDTELVRLLHTVYQIRAIADD